MIDLPKLAEKLMARKLMDKSFFSMTHGEILYLCEAVLSCPSDAVPVDGWQPPRIERGELIFPTDCHPRYRWWTPGGQSLRQTLIELEAPFEVARRYVHGPEGQGSQLAEEDWVNQLVPF
ncbi:MAG: hypothetical protein M0O99_08700 [Desulfuromonas thiophila]|nr:hypothetical protein [Desulfuromonas thiophila]